MTKTVLAALILTALAAPLFAGDERQQAEKKLFEAYYLENGKRDLKAAQSAYEELIWNNDEKHPDLAARGYIGLFRLAIRRSDPKGKDFMQGAEAAIKFAAKTADAATVELLNKELALAKSMLDDAAEKDGVEARIARFVAVLERSPDANNGKAAVTDLVLFGDRAVPAVAAKLRSDHPRGVAGAARVLVRIGTPAATAAMTKALTDAQVIFPAPIVNELGKAGPVAGSAPVLAAALADRRPNVRHAAASALVRTIPSFGGTAPDHWGVWFDGLESDDVQVRRTLLTLSASYWGTVRLIQAARLLIDDPDPVIANRLGQALAGSLYPSSDLPKEELAALPSLLAIRNKQARTRILQCAIQAGGEVAIRTLLLTIDDEHPDVRRESRHEIERRQGIWTEAMVPPLVASFKRIVMTEPTDTWDSATTYTMHLLDRAEENEANGNRLVSLLKSILAEAPEDRRGTAASYLYGVLQAYPASVQLAAYKVLVSDADRANWFKAFTPSAGEPAVALAGDALSSKNADLRAAAVLALSKSALDQRVVVKLTPLLADSNVQIRRTALQAVIVRLAVDKREQLALKALEDEDRTIRRTALEVITSFRDSSWFEPLLTAVEKDPSGIAVAAVLAVAARGHDDETRHFLVQVLDRLPKADQGLRAKAWNAAGEALTDQMILDALVSGEMPMVQNACIRAAKRHLLSAWPILLDLQSRYSFVPHYLKQLRDYHVGMKEYLDIRDTEEEDIYAKADALAASPDQQHRVAACYAYAALKGPRAMSKLLDLVRDEAASVREAALAALKKVSVE